MKSKPAKDQPQKETAGEGLPPRSEDSTLDGLGPWKTDCGKPLRSVEPARGWGKGTVPACQ
jgi:hypothetical protein